MKKNAGMINGVDVDRLFATIDAVGKDNSLADFRFRAENSWMRGGHNRSTIQGFYGAGQEDPTRTKPFVLDNDEPAVLLGEDHGANPVEYVLHALAGCVTTSLVYHASARGIRIDEVSSTLEGQLDLRGFLGMDDTVRNGYEKVRVTFRVKGDATDEQLEELCRVAQQRSPVFDIVSNPVPVEVKLERAMAMQPAA
jgi:uncharacterized OsmC-like protein